tara:strand:+ start:196 stop:366 length:171 start_codon:yes stop_codon:yes gene_type:complete
MAEKEQDVGELWRKAFQELRESEEVEGMVLAYIEQMCERGDGDAIELRTILLEEWT